MLVSEGNSFNAWSIEHITIVDNGAKRYFFSCRKNVHNNDTYSNCIYRVVARLENENGARSPQARRGGDDRRGVDIGEPVDLREIEAHVLSGGDMVRPRGPTPRPQWWWRS